MPTYLKTPDTYLLGAGYLVTRPAREPRLLGYRLKEHEAEDLLQRLESGEHYDRPVIGSARKTIWFRNEGVEE